MSIREEVISLILLIRNLGGSIKVHNNELELFLPDTDDAIEIRQEFLAKKDSIRRELIRNKKAPRIKKTYENIPVHRIQEPLLNARSKDHSRVLNCTNYYRIKGTVDCELLRKSYVEVLNNHSVFKLRLIKENSPSRVCWQKTSSLMASVHLVNSNDVSPDPSPGPRGNVDDYIKKLSSTCFNIEKDAVGCVTIIRLSPHETVVVEVFEHILIDGKSLNQLHREVEEAYKSNGDDFNTGENESYIDFLSEQYNEDSQRFWAEMFKDYELPSYSESDREISTWNAILSNKELEEIEKKCREIGCSVPDVSFAAHLHAIARFSGNSDACSFIAQDVRGVGYFNMIGNATHLLPIRIKHKWTDTLEDHCLRVSLLLARSRDYSDISVSHLRQSNAPTVLGAENMNAFVFQQDVMQGPSFANCDTTTIPIQSYYRAGNVTTVVRRARDGSLQVEMRSRNENHVNGRGHQILQTMVEFLRQLGGENRREIGSYDLLSPDCKNLLLESFVPVLDENNFDVIEKIALRLHDGHNKTVLVTPCGEVDKSTLRDEVDNRISLLESMGVLKGDAVIVACSEPINQISSYIATLSVGAIYIPICTSPDDPDKIKRLSARVSANIIINDDNIYRADRKLSVKNGNAETLEPKEDPAYIIFTSGTSGEPKGVVISRNSLNIFSIGEVSRFNLNSESRVLLIAPQDVDPWIAHVTSALLAGGVIVTANPAEDSISETIESCGVTHAYIPSALVSTVKLDERSRLEVLASAGDHCDASSLLALRNFSKRIVNIYGPTEATITALTHDVTETAHPIPIGKPIYGTGAFIMTEGAAYAPPGTLGELCLIGPTIGLGYLNELEGGKNGFMPSSHRGYRGYMTGDQGVLGTDGLFRIVGRIDRQVKIKGFRVDLDSVEMILKEDGLCSSARAIVTTVGRSKFLTLFFSGDNETSTVRSKIKHMFRREVFPNRIIRLPSIPLTHSGKPDDKALESLIEGQVIGDKEAATDGDREILFNCWIKVLGVVPADDSNFFSSGGDSLTALLFVHSLKIEGYNFRPADLYNFQTFGELLAHLGSSLKHEAADFDSEECLVAPDLPSQCWVSSVKGVNPRWLQRTIIDLRKQVSRDFAQEMLDNLVKKTPILRARFDAGSFLAAKTYKSPVRLQVASSSISESEFGDLLEQLERTIDPVLGEVLGAILFDERYLFLVCHHLAVDEWSWRLIKQRVDRYLYNPEASAFDFDAHVFKHAGWIRRLEKSGCFDLDIKYWDSVINSGLSTNVDGSAAHDAVLRGSIKVKIGHLSKQFAVSRSSVLLAVVAAALNEIEPNKISIVDFETNGRAIESSAELSDAVGWLGTHYPLVLNHRPFSSDSCVTIDKQISSIPDQGISYTVLRWMTKSLSSPKIGRLSINVSELDWAFGAREVGVVSTVERYIVKKEIHSFGHDAALMFRINGGEIRFDFFYSRPKFSLAHEFVAAMQTDEVARIFETDLVQHQRKGLIFTEMAFPVGKMQALMLRASEIFAEVYKPKIIFKLENFEHLVDSPSLLATILGSYPPFRWRYNVNAQGVIEQHMVPSDSVPVHVVSGDEATVENWFRFAEEITGENVLAGGHVAAARIIINSVGELWVCLQFHHAVCDGYTRDHFRELLHDFVNGKAECSACRYASKFYHANLRFVSAERRFSTATDEGIYFSENAIVTKLLPSFEQTSLIISPSKIDLLANSKFCCNYGLDIVIGSAVLAAWHILDPSMKIWFVVNARDFDIPGASSAAGLFWCFIEAAAVSGAIQDNILSSAQSFSLTFEEIRERSGRVGCDPRGVSFNFLRERGGSVGDSNLVEVNSSDYFHLNYQVVASGRADGGILLKIIHSSSLGRDTSDVCRRIMMEVIDDFLLSCS